MLKMGVLDGLISLFRCAVPGLTWTQALSKLRVNKSVCGTQSPVGLGLLHAARILVGIVGSAERRVIGRLLIVVV
jgi:hypothetical protein